MTLQKLYPGRVSIYLQLQVMQIMQDYLQDNKGSECHLIPLTWFLRPLPSQPFFSNSLDNFRDKLCHHW